MAYFLIVYLFLNGVWIPGDRFDGWGRREYPSQEICLERKEFAEGYQRTLEKTVPGTLKKRFECKPADGPEVSYKNDTTAVPFFVFVAGRPKGEPRKIFRKKILRG